MNVSLSLENNSLNIIERLRILNDTGIFEIWFLFLRISGIKLRQISGE